MRLSDVATVTDSVENVRQAAWMNDAPAVIVNIQRQPGANIIAVVDRIKALLPQLKTALPASVQMTILTDRTTTIRASVSDVEFELMLTVALVVMVIFLFLRTLAATVIPSVAVPLSLVGTFGVMYLLGYSLNNLTLMALTISTGFVVDDAIVMIENIARYIEAGVPPLEAALRGSRADRLHDSLADGIAHRGPHSAPLHGRHRRPAVPRVRGHAERHDPGLGVRVADADADDVRAAAAAAPGSRSRAGSIGRPRRRSRRSSRSMAARSAGCSDTRRRRCSWPSRRWCSPSRSAIVIPKGFFPLEDTGVIIGVSEAPQSVSFAAMVERQQALARVILRDPAVESLSSFIGIDVNNTTLNSGRMQINLKPCAKDDADASSVIRRLQPALAEVEGITLFMQPVQDLSVETQVSRTQFQYTLQNGRRRRACDMGAAVSRAPASPPDAARRRQRSAERGPAGAGRHRSRHGSRVSASRRRCSTTRCTTRLASDRSPRCSRS